MHTVGARKTKILTPYLNHKPTALEYIPLDTYRAEPPVLFGADPQISLSAIRARGEIYQASMLICSILF